MADNADLDMSPAGIEYIKDNFLCDDASSALWRGGLAAQQLGYHPYVSNAEERSWRSVKQLFPKGYRSQDCSELITNTCTIMRSWTESGQFKLSKEMTDPLRRLLRSSEHLVSERLCRDSDNDKAPQQRKRVTVHAWKSHSIA